jgi:mono/diheme cytochrome c family protein
MSRHTAAAFIALLALNGIAACGGGDKGQGSEQAPATPAASATGDLTPFQAENGVGPMTAVVQVGAVDHELAEAGEKLFGAKCSACHKMAEKYVGPALGEVTTRRTPTYVMNMILNPDGMTAKHPEARKLLGEFMTQMPNLALTQDEARKILEYLRSQGTTSAGREGQPKGE